MLFSVLTYFSSYYFLIIHLYSLGATVIYAGNKPISNFKDYQLINFPICLALGSIIWAALTILLVILGYSNSIIQLILALISVYGIIRSFRVFRKITKEIIIVSILCCSFNVLLNVFVNFPDGKLGSVNGLQVMRLAGLEADSMIPYNFSRFIVERIDPSSRDVVPLWRASERPPLLAIVSSGYSILFGATESAPWMETSSFPFSVFQIAGTFMNSLSLILVGVIAIEINSLAAAAAAILLLGTNYFYVLNIFFTWPKFLMAFYLILALYISELKSYFKLKYYLIGLLLGAALLSHEMCIFTIGVYFILKIVTLKKFQVKLPHIYYLVNTFVGLLVIYLPWVIYKNYTLLPALKGPAYHFFCYKDETYNTSINFLFHQYVSSFSVKQYFTNVMKNMLFPFYMPEIAPLFTNPIHYINYGQSFFFSRFVNGFGLFTIPFFVFGGIKIYKNINYKNLFNLLLVLIIGFLALVFTTGCAEYTSNHVWVYPLYLLFSIFVGLGCVKMNYLFCTLFSIQLIINISTLLSYLYFQSSLHISDHSELSYRFLIVALISVFFTGNLFFLFNSPERESK